ncbi:hypothetical protein SODALDRAFT_326466, partial [Sodiomyces alkalinus F11]
MAGSSKAVWPDTLDRSQFDELVASYKPLIATISKVKDAKPSQKSLEELDRFRYAEAPSLFSQNHPKRAMSHEDVKVLVDWKLRHGRFRPTLMKLVSSNDPENVEETIKQGIDIYRDESDASKSLKMLTKLKGIGPATASLLLAVHFPDEVPFFSDESYYWLCNKGQQGPLKYNMKEYETLISSARKLMKRLGVAAIDVERASYVAMKGDGKPVAVGPAASTKSKLNAGSSGTGPSSAKRKTMSKDDEATEPQEALPLRRSKRGRGLTSDA